MSDNGNDNPTLDVTHRALLQAFMAQQTFVFEQVQPIIARILTAKDPSRPTRTGDITIDDLRRYIEDINEAVSTFDFEIRSTKHQKSGIEYFSFVNTTSDALTQMSTVHSADEIAFVRRVLDAMFETYNTRQAEVMAVTSMQWTKLAKVQQEDRRDSGTGRAPAASLTGTQAENVMQSMVREGWFEQSAKGYYTLTPRALMELREWLIDTYNEPEDEEDDEPQEHVKIKKCYACKEIITVGQRCPDLSCEGRLHTRCAGQMFRALNGDFCPLCKTSWTDPRAVGEKAASRQSNSTSQRRSNGTSQRRTTNMDFDGANDDDGSE